jgi:hypothetical protein
MNNQRTVGTAFLALAISSAAAARDDSADRPFLTSRFWDDGKAEIAFYQVERDVNQYGEAKPQKFLMGTYLVKHDFDRLSQSKARPDAKDKVPSFKWSAFYEFESDNSYQFKQAWVVNAAQEDLAPLKASFTSFDWCSNQYRELLFRPDGKAEFLMRSDDYGNREETFEAPSGSYPVALVPLLVRSLDFSGAPSRSFSLLLEDGSTVKVTARLEGRESLDLPDGREEAERVRLSFDGDYRSILSRKGEREETYWRGLGAERALLALESATYRMRLVEIVRSPYWDENVFPRLKHVKTRP